eukprot:gene32870-20855_t
MDAQQSGGGCPKSRGCGSSSSPFQQQQQGGCGKSGAGQLRTGGGRVVELANTGEVEESVAGWRLCDDEGCDHDKAYVFPEDATVAPGGYLVVCKGADGFAFGIGSSDTVTLLDSGGANADSTGVLGGAGVADRTDWVEVANTGAADAALAGWRLCGDKGCGNADAYDFPSDVTVPTGGYLVVCREAQDGDSLSGGFVFGISDSETVTLVDPSGATQGLDCGACVADPPPDAACTRTAEDDDADEEELFAATKFLWKEDAPVRKIRLVMSPANWMDLAKDPARE